VSSIKITVDRLQPGLHIRLPVKWNEHPFLLNSFKIKKQEQIEIIKHLGIQHVYLSSNKSDTKPLPVSNESKVVPSFDSERLDIETGKLWNEKHQRIETLNRYRRKVVQCEKEFERSLSRMRSVMNKIRNRPLDAVYEAESLVSDIVDTLLLSENSVSLHLMNNNESEFDDVYFHSLNVAIIAMMIGKAKKYDADTIKELSFAALFHDIGKVKIPKAILKKQTLLSEPEKNYLKHHIKYGLDLVNTIQNFSESAKVVISQHHELINGSGYPNGLKGKDIDEYSKVIAVANIFDNLCHPVNPKDQKIPYAALSYLFKSCKHLYDEENLGILVKFMGVFPPGTVVQLSNEMVGLVMSVNNQNLLHPNVLMYDPSVPRHQAPIIALAERDLSIVSAILPHKLPDKIKEYLNPRTRISYFINNDD